MKRIAVSGFTLVEMLVSITIMGIIAAAMIPLLSSNDPQKLSVAAEETANLLRFAMSEAKRTGGHVLVDCKVVPGHVKLFNADNTGNANGAINDPLTKRAIDLDVRNSAYSQGVILTPQFRGGGVIRQQLLVGATGPGLTLESMNGIGNRSALQPNSGVLLSYSGQSITVSINEITGLVSLP